MNDTSPFSEKKFRELNKALMKYANSIAFEISEDLREDFVQEAFLTLFIEFGSNLKVQAEPQKELIRRGKSRIRTVKGNLVSKRAWSERELPVELFSRHSIERTRKTSQHFMTEAVRILRSQGTKPSVIDAFVRQRDGEKLVLIAQELGMNNSTLRSQIRRCRETLKRLLPASLASMVFDDLKRKSGERSGR